MIKSLLIAIPTTSQQMKSGTALTIANVVKLMTRQGVDVDLHNIDSAEIVTARDMFANMLFHSDRWDGLFFIDSDMAFEPELALRLINHGGEVVGVASPRRTLDFSRLIAHANATGDIYRARSYASDFTVKLSWNIASDQELATVSNGFCEAAAVGMACTFIAKSALVAMVEEGSVGVRPDLHTGDGKACWAFFRNIDHGQERLGEDYSFCFRWTEAMKRPLYVCVDEEMTHIGSFDFTGRYADLFIT